MPDNIKFSKSVFDTALLSAAHVLQYIEADCRQEMMDNLRLQMTRYAEMEEKFKGLKEITSNFRQELKRSDHRATANEDSNERKGSKKTPVNVEKLLKRYNSKVEGIEVNVANNNNLRHFSQQMDQLMKYLAGEQGTSDDTEDDMVMTSSLNVICPISKTRMIEPVKNDICGHVYDLGSVTKMIESNARSRCPLMGCSNSTFLSMDHLSADIVTRLYLERNP
ncbi:E3 SUMO-protein ligase NSE2-like [Diachasmimorpha longicaudata]|uniref:E3 SUMO-protein ligase NSE2-like n=1 Tax=Diachasmimorpha longicaudata TaxID=58733 RepID=UPI0030B8AAFD